jgi:hypothetical protein
MNARASANYQAIARSASKSVEIYWADFFLGPNLISFNRAVVPLLELSFLTKSHSGAIPIFLINKKIV